MLLLTGLLTISYIKGRVLAILAQFLMKALLKKSSSSIVDASDRISCCSLQGILLLVFSPKRTSFLCVFDY